jgi:topoisomerase IV subunit A
MPTEAFLPVSLEDEISESYGRYARYTILHRAIPDVRDGLKPVQRRIVYAKYQSGNLPDRAYRKCAKTVGDVMGNFHPHGDQSIYDALVRLAQPWKMLYPLVDGHGNFGSMDDDPPAAMRYTDSRLAPVALTLLQDIEKDTVPFALNFDQSAKEPVVLPSRFPNLLVNGCSGLSTGFATEIPPHNLGEVLDAAIELSRRPDLTTASLLQIVRGPDFPTGGIVVNAADLLELYEKGRGRIVLRARARVEAASKQAPPQIVIDQIPFGVVKSNLVAELDQIRLGALVRGVTDVRDESDRDGLRIVVELERTADAEGILNYFFKKTGLQVGVPVQMVAIAQGAPRQMGLKEVLARFLDHRREVVLRRSRFELEASRKRLHEVDGLIQAIEILDDVISLIRSSRDRAEAKTRLVAVLEFSEAQAETILELRLHRLTSLQIEKLRREAEELEKTIARLEAILSDERQLVKVIRAELRELRNQFGRERVTQITDAEARVEVALTVTVPPQKVNVALTTEGYIKRCSPRAEQDPEKAGVRPGDTLRWVVESNTTHRLLLFTAEGACHNLGVHTLPEARWGDTGSALVNITDLRAGQRVVGCFSVETFEPGWLVTLVTAQGRVKRTPISEFETTRSTGILAIKLGDGDEVVRALVTRASGQLLLVTSEGQAIRFVLEEVTEQMRAAAGVRGITLEDRDRVVEALYVEHPRAQSVVVFTEQGKGKRTPLEAYPVQGRGGKGTQTIKRLARAGHVVAAAALVDMEDEPWWVATSSGRILPLAPTQVTMTARDGNAYRLLDLESGELLLHQAVHLQRRSQMLADREAEALARAAAAAVQPQTGVLQSGRNGGHASARGANGGSREDIPPDAEQLGLYDRRPPS